MVFVCFSKSVWLIYPFVWCKLCIMNLDLKILAFKIFQWSQFLKSIFEPEKKYELLKYFSTADSGDLL